MIKTKKHRLCDRKYQQRMRKLYPDKKKKEVDLYRKNHPERVSAYKAVGRALKAGMIKKGKCFYCKRKDTHAHHEDYSKKLDIMWLCPIHHKVLHLVGCKKMKKILSLFEPK
jgi:hypothetical protein